MRRPGLLKGWVDGQQQTVRDRARELRGLRISALHFVAQLHAAPLLTVAVLGRFRPMTGEGGRR
jgi:hypothetical protein